MSYILKFFEIIAPILYGIVFAYLLAPIQNFFEYKMFFKLTRKSMNPRIVKLRRVLSLTLTALIVLIALSAVVYVLVPGVVDSVEKLGDNLDGYIEDLENNLSSYLESGEHKGKFFSQIYEHILKTVGGGDGTPLFSAVVKRTGDWVISLFSEDNIRRIFSFGSSVLTVLINILLTVFFTVYLLYSKERQTARMRKLLSSMFKKERVEGIYRVAYMTDEHVGRYLRMQVIDCILVGLVSFLVYTIIGLPYAPLLAVISGVTNIIPYFGPFIGAVPNGLFILLAAPDKLLPFIIAVVIIQQIDGNILVPILQSTTMKIDTFWVLVGLTVMGGIFGIPGMVLGVPFFAVAYFLIRERAERRLTEKGLPTDTDAYIVLHHERKKNHPQPPIVKAYHKIRARMKKVQPGDPPTSGASDSSETSAASGTPADSDAPAASDASATSGADETPPAGPAAEPESAQDVRPSPESEEDAGAKPNKDDVKEEFDLIDRGKEKVRRAVTHPGRKKKK